VNGGDLFLRPPAECEQPYTVTQINEGVARRLEAGNTVVWFTGEISNFKRHTSGHCYLRLKDAASQVPAVVWSSNVRRLDFEPWDGAEVTGVAALRVYQKGGYYQLDIQRMQPAGLGALFAAFEALKKKLAAEGLFDEARKRPLPDSVATVGVVTSKTGAALRDIVRVVASRAPGTDILLCNVAVQGNKAAAKICAGIAAMNAHGGADILIVGRGGGSIEDLWAFNEEAVARAIAASRIPVISAVGHETDFTIADFVADARAATPSAAAEMAVADGQERRRYFTAAAQRFVNGFARLLGARRDRFAAVSSSPGLRKPAVMILEARQTIDDRRARLGRALGILLKQDAAQLRAAGRRLHALSPLKVLSRGYAVVTREDGAAVRDSGQVRPGDRVRMRFSAGGADARIEHIHPGDGRPEQGGGRTV